MYYKHKAVFKNMSTLLGVVQRVADLLNCTRAELRLVACVLCQSRSHRSIWCHTHAKHQVAEAHIPPSL